MIKNYIQRKLGRYAEEIVRKYHPLVIGVTGSVGKTSAKEAVFAALSSEEGVSTNSKNFNNEIGVPLSVLQIHNSPRRSPGAWAVIFLKARKLLKQHLPYPKILILEMGIDHPGDMDYLADMVKPQIAIVTAIGQAHIAYFGTEQRIAEEKTKIFKHLGTTGTSIINYDDSRLRSLLPKFNCKTLTYGTNSGADIRANSINVAERNIGRKQEWGTSSIIEYGKEHAELFLPGLIGSGHVLSCLAGIAAAIATGISFSKAVENLKNYKPQPGRMRLLPGVWNSLIIDDTYNSSPQAALLAISELQKFPSPNKIAVLGDMRELGTFSEQAHRDLALPLLKSGINKVILVGNEMRSLALELAAIGYPRDQIAHFKNSFEVAKLISKLATPETVFLVKGSQNTIRMERVVKALLRHPEQAGHLLVRQEDVWLKIK